MAKHNRPWVVHDLGVRQHPDGETMPDVHWYRVRRGGVEALVCVHIGTCYETEKYMGPPRGSASKWLADDEAEPFCRQVAVRREWAKYHPAMA